MTIKILLIHEDEPEYLLIRQLSSQIETIQLELEWARGEEHGLKDIVNFGQHDVYLIEERYLTHTGTALSHRLEVLQQNLSTLTTLVSPSPVILLTASPQMGRKALQAGAADYLDKHQLSAPLLERSLRLAQARLKESQAPDHWRKRVEQALRQHDIQSQAILEAIPDLILRVTRDGSCLDCRFPRDSKAKAFVPIKRHLSELLSPELLQRQLQFIEQAISSHELQVYEHQLEKQGKVAYEEVRISAINENQALIIVRDITERKQTEAQLRYRLTLEKALALVSTELITDNPVDLNNVLGLLGVAVNASRVYLTRFRAEGTQADLVHEWCDRHTQSELENFQKINTPRFPWWMEKMQGNQNIVIPNVEELPEAAQAERDYLRSVNVNSVLAVPIYDRSGQLWGNIGFNTSGTKHKSWSDEDTQLLRVAGGMIYTYHSRLLAQEKLRASEALYAGIFNHSAEAIFLVDVLPNGQFVYETMNPAYEQATGITLEQFSGKMPAQVMSPEMASRVEASYRACIAIQETLSYEETLNLPVGRRIWRTNLVPIADASGRIIKLQGSSRDITEEIAQRQELARSNKDLEQFAYIASHDLQQPLQIVADYAQLLKRRYQDQLDAKAEKFIQYIVEGAKQMQKQINDLLEYSRVGTRKKPLEVIDCNQVLEQAIANLQPIIHQQQVVVMLSGRLPTLMADPAQLLQLWQNLLGNAIKYRSETSPVIQIGVEHQEEGWLFSIEDNGIGIDPKHSERIFQIFQRLHAQDEYPGTGIGLAICQRIVARHGGRIWVESELNRGSTFYFTIQGSSRATD
jgi:PAS domain S-box-containing protein